MLGATPIPISFAVLKGCRKRRELPVIRKRASTIDYLCVVVRYLPSQRKYHDASLFLAILFMGFLGVMRLGEFISPDNPKLWESRKASTLFRQADRFSEGNKVFIPGVDRMRILLYRMIISRSVFVMTSSGLPLL